MEQQEKHIRFQQKAHSKVETIVKKIRVLQNYADRTYYDYSALEVMKILSEIESALNETRKKYIYELQSIEADFDEDEDDFDEDEE